MLFLQAYEDALAVLKPILGELHVSVRRCYQQLGVHHEERREYGRALEWYHRWYELCCELHGADHELSRAVLTILREPFYQQIARKKGLRIY